MIRIGDFDFRMVISMIKNQLGEAGGLLTTRLMRRAAHQVSYAIGKALCRRFEQENPTRRNRTEISSRLAGIFSGQKNPNMLEI